MTGRRWYKSSGATRWEAWLIVVGAMMAAVVGVTATTRLGWLTTSAVSALVLLVAATANHLLTRRRRT